MPHRPGRRALLVAVAVLVSVFVTTSIATGSPGATISMTKRAVKKLVKKEVRKQVARKRGPTGPTGPAGPQGPGASLVAKEIEGSVTLQNSVGSLILECPARHLATTYGYSQSREENGVRSSTDDLVIEAVQIGRSGDSAGFVIFNLRDSDDTTPGDTFHGEAICVPGTLQD